MQLIQPISNRADAIVPSTVKRNANGCRKRLDSINIVANVRPYLGDAILPVAHGVQPLTPNLKPTPQFDGGLWPKGLTQVPLPQPLPPALLNGLKPPSGLLAGLRGLLHLQASLIPHLLRVFQASGELVSFGTQALFLV